jgi:hypothetical protein
MHTSLSEKLSVPESIDLCNVNQYIIARNRCKLKGRTRLTENYFSIYSVHVAWLNSDHTYTSIAYV